MKFLILLLALICPFSVKGDLVPYSIHSVRAISNSGFIELVGPGKLESKGIVHPYKETESVFISIKNIQSLSRVAGVKDGCVIRYSSNDYSEDISVLKQSCEDVLTEIAKTK